MCVPLALLFRKSLDEGVIPHDWKLGAITPIYKKGDKRNPGNYRPVSLTAIPCKLLESLIKDALLNYLDAQQLLSDHQHGFRPKRSCDSQLLEALGDWTRQIEEGHPIDTVYLDFQKAFDSVPHERL